MLATRSKEKSEARDYSVNELKKQLILFFYEYASSALASLRRKDVESILSDLRDESKPIAKSKPKRSVSDDSSLRYVFGSDSSDEDSKVRSGSSKFRSGSSDSEEIKIINLDTEEARAMPALPAIDLRNSSKDASSPSYGSRAASVNSVQLIQGSRADTVSIIINSEEWNRMASWIMHFKNDGLDLNLKPVANSETYNSRKLILSTHILNPNGSRRFEIIGYDSKFRLHFLILNNYFEQYQRMMDANRVKYFFQQVYGRDHYVIDDDAASTYLRHLDLYRSNRLKLSQDVKSAFDKNMFSDAILDLGLNPIMVESFRALLHTFFDHSSVQLRFYFTLKITNPTLNSRFINVIEFLKWILDTKKVDYFGHDMQSRFFSGELRLYMDKCFKANTARVISL